MSVHRHARPIKLPTSSGNVGGGLPTTGLIDVSALSGVETGGFPVTAVIRSGGSAGPVIATLQCSANAAGSNPTPINVPVRCSGPLYCQIIGTGVIDAAVHVL